MQTRDEMRLKMKDIRSAPQDQRKAMRREIMEHADSKILAMLNPDQQKQYQSYKQEMREDMKKRASDRRQQRSELDDEVY
jgi:ATP-dependent protease HslVU (ClpYQ) ATPase subunit